MRYADRRASVGWQALLGQAFDNLDRAWVAITSDPRNVGDRQHRLKSAYSTVRVAGAQLEQWQYEVTAAARIWYAIDDERRTLWITQAAVGHPRQTDTRGGRS